MALHRRRNNLFPFLVPRRNVGARRPGTFHERSECPSICGSYGQNRNSSAHGYVGVLRDGTLADRAGDLGWSLNYATAWCYRHLLGNQPEIVDTIDRIRDTEYSIDELPFLIFDTLDEVLFRGKLRGMVYLQWSFLHSSSTGTTSAPGIVGTRITIQLNATPFQGTADGIDALLEAVIHQMIHAFFLICCGAQKRGVKQDGRLMDGVNFGVLLLTIRDITRECAEGRLSVVFHASRRRDVQCSGPYQADTESLRFQLTQISMSSQDCILLNPPGIAVAPPTANGRTYCMYDNRTIHWADIRNWLVEGYALALEADMESKGNCICEFTAENQFKMIDRLKGPPSSTYAELVFTQDGGNRRVMVPRERALAFKSITERVMNNERYEFQIPECEMETFRNVYEFVVRKGYCPRRICNDIHLQSLDDSVCGTSSASDRRKTAPVLLQLAQPLPVEDQLDAIAHIKVLKVAEKAKFAELMAYALDRLWNLPYTSSDPVVMLAELYDAHAHKPAPDKPIHAELHRWALAFLRRTETEALADARHRAYRLHGASNYEKICAWHPDRFARLLHRSSALRDDVELVTGGPLLLVAPNVHHNPIPSQASAAPGTTYCQPLSSPSELLRARGGESYTPLVLDPQSRSAASFAALEEIITAMQIDNLQPGLAGAHCNLRRFLAFNF